LEPQAIERALDSLVQWLSAKEEVCAVVHFGSVARGRGAPGSDLDVLVVLKDSPLPFLDRVPVYTPDDFPMPLDVFPYTVQELSASPPLAREAVTTGRTLWQRSPATLDLDLVAHP